MGVPFDIVFKEKHVEFRLPNKPEHLCYIDIEDFHKHVEGTKCWYIHKGSTSRSSLYYVRRTLWPSTNTGHLHRYVVGAGEFCLATSVVDHLDGNGLDNRSENVILANHEVNMQNRKNSARIRHHSYSITYLSNRDSYQCYDRKTYIGSSKSLDVMKEKIDKYISKQNQEIGKCQKAITN